MVSQAIVDLVRARLANLRACSDTLKGVDHLALRGRFREILVQDLLAPYLPPQVEPLTGVIVGTENEQREVRNEDDIVLFDYSWAPLLLKTRGRDSIIPVTGVRAHIEVKSILRLTDLKKALVAAIEINQMAVGEAPTGLLFAYDSDIDSRHHIPDLLLRELQGIGYKPNKGQTPYPIQAVCILDRGSWFLTDVNGIPGWYEVKAEDDREILAFVSIVSNSLFGNKKGLGTHVLDTSWLIGPNPKCPRVV